MFCRIEEQVTQNSILQKMKPYTKESHALLGYVCTVAWVFNLTLCAVLASV